MCRGLLYRISTDDLSRDGSTLCGITDCKDMCKAANVFFNTNQVKEDNGIHKGDRTNGRQSIRNASSVFFDIYDAKSICDSLVEGGRKGISVQSAFSSEEEVQVKAIYTLKLSFDFRRILL